MVSNAVIYSNEAESVIVVSAAYNSRDDQLHIQVKDSGIGIPYSDVGKLFKRETKLENGGRQNPSGLGMGLYISKLLAKQLDATLEYDKSSGNGPGATFILTLQIDTA